MGSMSDSSSDEVIKDEHVNEQEIKKPGWLDDFLGKTFFGQCGDHPERRNELNKYCINCDQAACQYCVSSGAHQQHKILKVYRHIYKDVVSLGTMEKYIDCSEIQPYKSNKRLVVSLNPLPHAGSASNNEASCNSCSRKLVEPDVYRYCCISCKVRAGSPELNAVAPPAVADGLAPPAIADGSAPPAVADGLAPPAVAAGSDPPAVARERQNPPSEFPEGSLRKKRRKGIPQRAPFF